MANDHCRWERHTDCIGEDEYRTGCGQSWGCFTEKPLHDSIQFCPFCGKRICAMKHDETPPNCLFCGSAEEMLFIDTASGWECQDEECCYDRTIPVRWIAERETRDAD